MSKKMKNKDEKQIRFPAWFVMLLLVIIGISIIIVSFFIPDTMVASKIGKKVTEIIGGALISVGILDFLISISDERKLLEKVQTNICNNTDFSSLKPEHLRIINENLTKSIIDDVYSSIDNNDKPNGLSEQLSNRYWDNIDSRVYLKRFSRRVRVNLVDEGVAITTTTDIIYVNAEDIVGKKHYISPLFTTSGEADSFDVYKLKHNDSDLKEDYDKWANNKETKIEKAKMNNTMYQRTPSFYIDISKKGKHAIHYVTGYTACYTAFFQTASLYYDCETYDLSVGLTDNRTNKDNSYMLRWDIFTSPFMQDQMTFSTCPCIYAGNEYVSLTNGVNKWMPKGSGYVLTLNEIKEYTDPKKAE